MNTKNLFILSFIAILTTYYFILGIDKSIQLIKDEYLSILALIVILLSLLFFKLKLKGHQTINFIQNNQFSLKSTILFFLVFQVVDYYYENGFIGMISQWFLYWIMGLIAITLMETINCYKNYKYLKNKP
ncbi:hypothetical protein [Arcobacter arenosus]|uniref:Uncharacterized protein n=1 Tax=Arcobacter arenosus TaxID=2576037 RepID=A0A5R8XZC4_9BACT|nr:hypothetical protein [Arcobacter arenosus]TLP37589.1 hypothetical protein FDK22_09710 [Arcobacter arenosus]